MGQNNQFNIHTIGNNVFEKLLKEHQDEKRYSILCGDFNARVRSLLILDEGTCNLNANLNERRDSMVYTRVKQVIQITDDKGFVVLNERFKKKKRFPFCAFLGESTKDLVVATSVVSKFARKRIQTTSANNA